MNCKRLFLIISIILFPTVINAYTAEQHSSSSLYMKIDFNQTDNIKLYLNWEGKLKIEGIIIPSSNYRNYKIYLQKIPWGKIAFLLKKTSKEWRIKNGLIKDGYIEITIQDNLTTIKGDITSKNTTIYYKESMFEGDVSLNGMIVIKNKIPTYSIKYKIQKGKLFGLNEITMQGTITDKSFSGTNIQSVYESVYGGIRLKGDFNIRNFSSPILTLNMKLDGGIIPYGINVFIPKGRIHKETKTATFPLIKIKTPLSKLQIKSSINLQYPYYLVADGNGEMELQELLTTIKYFSPSLKNIHTKGILNTRFHTKFNFLNNDINAEIISYGKKILINGLSWEDIFLHISQIGNKIILRKATANYKDGKILLQALWKRNYSFGDIYLNIENIKLSQIIKDLRIDSDLSGNLSSTINIKGNFTKKKHISGKGEIKIIKGYLWEINIFKGLGEILFIKPDFKSIIFKEGYGKFTFNDQGVNFTEISLISPNLTLKGEGNISFLKDINITIIPQINPNFIKGTRKLRDVIDDIIGKTGIGIEIYGKIDKPKYKILPVVELPLKNIRHIIKNILDNSFIP